MNLGIILTFYLLPNELLMKRKKIIAKFMAIQ